MEIFFKLEGPQMASRDRMVHPETAAVWIKEWYDFYTELRKDY